MQRISEDELSKHNSADDLWVSLKGKVYDLTEFANKHPGGPGIILAYAGKDATRAFEPYHPSGILSTLPEGLVKGIFVGKPSPSMAEPSKVVHETPPIHHMVNVFDFEPLAEAKMSNQGWTYYSTGSGDESTLKENRIALSRYQLCPRVMRNVGTIDTSSTLLGHPTSFPVYITATALGNLAHPEGEVLLAKAASAMDIIQMCPTLSSWPLEDILKARSPNRIQFFQLYVHGDRNVTLDLIKRAERGGCRALVITVDAPQLGLREKDMRNRFSMEASNVQKGSIVKRSQGVSRALSSFINPDLCWEDIAWIRSSTKIPIVLKGIQTAEDALMAAFFKVDGLVVSNHGGRQMDNARASIDILEEVVEALDRINCDMEIMVDGGFRRGSDIFKALALGAKAVGMGRPFLYAMAAYGQEGVEKCIQLLKEEFEMCMRLMGVVNVNQINKSMVCRVMEKRVVSAENVYKDFLSVKSRL